MRFKTKPVVIEAIKFDGTIESVTEMLDKWKSDFANVHRLLHLKESVSLIIETLEGNHAANPGDWIIKGTLGEFYPCKPQAFENKYEPA